MIAGDDGGNVVWFGDPTQKIPTMDPTIPAFQSWFVKFPLNYFGDEAKELFDGVFVDADGWQPGEWPNISAARYDKLFAGKMAMNTLAQKTYDALNGGSVWGNGGTSLNPIAAQGGPSDKVNVHTCLDHMDGGFIEWLGSFWYMQDFSKVTNNGTSPQWNASLMQSGFHNILEASGLGKNVRRSLLLPACACFKLLSRPFLTSCRCAGDHQDGPRTLGDAIQLAPGCTWRRLLLRQLGRPPESDQRGGTPAVGGGAGADAGTVSHRGE